MTSKITSQQTHSRQLLQAPSSKGKISRCASFFRAAGSSLLNNPLRIASILGGGAIGYALARSGGAALVGIGAGFIHHCIQSAIRSRPTERAIRNLIVKKIMGIANDGAQRRLAYKTDLSVLDRGFWYPNDYFDCLQARNQKGRIEYLKANNSFFHGIPPKGFSPVSDPASPSGIRASAYRLKDGVLPSEGIKAVRQTLCTIDCLEGVELAYYEALLEILGVARFNDFFRADGPNPLSFDPDLKRTPLISFMIIKDVSGSLGKLGDRPVDEGDSVHFRNAPLYHLRHPEEEWGGLHAICTQSNSRSGRDQKFTGFGTPAEGFTEDQIFDLFAHEFNKKPKPRSLRYSEQLTKALDAADARAPSPYQSLSKEECIEIALTHTTSKQEIIATSKQSPKEVGFFFLIFKPNIKYIRALANRS